MKLEIRSHYWPATPHLREIKIVVDDKVLISKFLKEGEILKLKREILANIVNSIEE